MQSRRIGDVASQSVTTGLLFVARSTYDLTSKDEFKREQEHRDNSVPPRASEDAPPLHLQGSSL